MLWGEEFRDDIGGCVQMWECGMTCRLRVALLVCCPTSQPVLLPALDLQLQTRLAQIKAWGHLSSWLTWVPPAPSPERGGGLEVILADEMLLANYSRTSHFVGTTANCPSSPGSNGTNLPLIRLESPPVSSDTG